MAVLSKKKIPDRRHAACVAAAIAVLNMSALLPAEGETIAILDTVKGETADEVIHIPAPGAPLPAPGTEVRPCTMTGRDGPADSTCWPFSSSMARTRP